MPNNDPKPTTPAERELWKYLMGNLGNNSTILRLIADVERRPTLKDLCAQSGYVLVYDQRPFERPDAIGMRGAGQFAQLCDGGVIASSCFDVDAIYCVSHELAHGTLWGQSNWTEQEVFTEQARILSKWLVKVLA